MYASHVPLRRLIGKMLVQTPTEFCISSCNTPACHGPTFHHASQPSALREEPCSFPLSLSVAAMISREFWMLNHDQVEVDSEQFSPKSSPSSRLTTEWSLPSFWYGSVWVAEPNGTCQRSLNRCEKILFTFHTFPFVPRCTQYLLPLCFLALSQRGIRKGYGSFAVDTVILKRMYPVRGRYSPKGVLYLCEDVGKSDFWAISWC
jgi:hypothetical protein